MMPSRVFSCRAPDSAFSEADTASEAVGILMLMRKFYPLTGGYQNQALRLATELRKNGFTIHVLTQRHGTLAPFEVHQGIPIHRVFAFRTGHLASWSYLLSGLWWMLRNRSQFHIIHANRSSSGLVAGLIGFLLRKPVLYKLTRGDEVDVKGLGTGLLGWLKIASLRSTVGKFISLTSQTVEDLVRLGIPPESISMIPNGISLEARLGQYDRETIRAELVWGPEVKVVTFVGRLVYAKGLDWLLDVWKTVSSAEPEARLLIVGDGPERAPLSARAEELGLTQTVTFAGRQEDVYRFFSISDVFVLPSRLEGISNSLLEAMSQGLPVVAADDRLGGNRSVITDKRDGMIIPQGDSEEFARVLLSLLRDQALRAEMGRRARLKVENAFSIASVSRRYRQIYHELLRRPEIA
jgi:glycosyltransferase involved in cell wall biosynthesis